MSEVGHNSVAAGDLRSIVERIERLQESKDEIAQDIKEVYVEAKARGFDNKALRRIVALRRIDDKTREKMATVLDLYASALGMTVFS